MDDSNCNQSFRSSTILTLRLLEEISSSINTFKPSKSLEELHSMSLSSSSDEYAKRITSDCSDNSDYEDSSPIADIDVVISGGGLKGYFMVGATFILAKEMKKRNLRVARVAGTSAGSWGGMFLLWNLHKKFNLYYWLETFHQCRENLDEPLLEVYWKYYSEHLRGNPEILPDDAYTVCNGRLFISYTAITVYGPQLRIVSEFTSNDDVVAACCASSSIPFMTQRGMARKYRGEYVCDGGVFNNVPIFKDGARRQLVFRLFDVEYPFRFVVKPLDTCIDMLVLRGAITMQRFLQGEPAETVAWLERQQLGHGSKISYAPFIRAAVIPVAIVGVILSNATGLRTAISNVLESIGVHKQISSTIIAFEDVNIFYGMYGPIRFAFDILAASATDLLRRLSVLL